MNLSTILGMMESRSFLPSFDEGIDESDQSTYDTHLPATDRIIEEKDDLLGDMDYLTSVLGAKVRESEKKVRDLSNENVGLRARLATVEASLVRRREEKVASKEVVNLLRKKNEHLRLHAQKFLEMDRKFLEKTEEIRKITEELRAVRAERDSLRNLNEELAEGMSSLRGERDELLASNSLATVRLRNLSIELSAIKADLAKADLAKATAKSVEGVRESDVKSVDKMNFNEYLTFSGLGNTISMSEMNAAGILMNDIRKVKMGLEMKMEDGQYPEGKKDAVNARLGVFLENVVWAELYTKRRDVVEGTALHNENYLKFISSGLVDRMIEERKDNDLKRIEEFSAIRDSYRRINEREDPTMKDMWNVSFAYHASEVNLWPFPWRERLPQIDLRELIRMPKKRIVINPNLDTMSIGGSADVILDDCLIDIKYCRDLDEKKARTMLARTVAYAFAANESRGFNITSIGIYDVILNVLYLKELTPKDFASFGFLLKSRYVTMKDMADICPEMVTKGGGRGGKKIRVGEMKKRIIRTVGCLHACALIEEKELLVVLCSNYSGGWLVQRVFKTSQIREAAELMGVCYKSMQSEIDKRLEPALGPIVEIELDGSI